MKGMAHTPFAIFGVTVLLMLFMIPLNSVPEEAEQNVKAAEAANAQAHNLESVFAEGLGITAAYYIEASNNYVVDQGFVSDAESAIDFDQGEFNGEEMDFMNYSEWLSGVESKYEDRGHNLEYSHNNLGLNEGLRIVGEADLEYSFTRSAIAYRMDGRVEGAAGIRGPDPLLEDASGGAFTPQYGYCGFDRPAQQLGQGSESSGDVAHGYAVIKPDEIEPGENQILIVENASQYGAGELSEFNGVIAEEEASVENGDYAHISGLELSGISSGDSIIIDGTQAWKANFRKIINENCYVSTSNAPGIFNRMKGSFSASNQGLTTFLGNQSSASELNEAYMYYNGSSASNSGVEGVTSGDYGEFMPWFRISDNNINEWGIEALSR